MAVASGQQHNIGEEPAVIRACLNGLNEEIQSIRLDNLPVDIPSTDPTIFWVQTTTSGNNAM